MKPNAKLTFKFPKTTFSFDVQWKNEHFVNGADIAQKTFFSSDPVMVQAFSEGTPKMSVTLNKNPKIKSSAFYEDITGEVFPRKNLDTITP